MIMLKNLKNLLIIIYFFNLTIEGKSTKSKNNINQIEIVNTCVCMNYWSCIGKSGIIYSSCGLLDICCLISNKTKFDQDESDYLKLILKLLKKQTIQSKENKSLTRKSLFKKSIQPRSNLKLNDKNQTIKLKDKFKCGQKGKKSSSLGTSVPGEWPWHLALVDQNIKKFICGASLIQDQFALTAAHCFNNYKNISMLKVRLGEHDIRTENESILAYQEIGIKKILVHPKFSRITLNNDIALIQLSKKAILNSNVQKVCLPSKTLSNSTNFVLLQNSQCFVTGWGKVSEVKSYSFKLKEINVPIWSSKQCVKSLKYFFGNRSPSMESVICAGSINQDACDGDGGGPLVCNLKNKWYQVGIVSFGIGCGRPNIPGVYTSLMRHSSWIQKQLNKFKLVEKKSFKNSNQINQ